MARIVRLRKVSGHGSDRSKYPWCRSCYRERRIREQFSRRGMCDDCSMLRELAFCFARGRKLRVVDGVFDYYVIADEKGELTYLEMEHERDARIAAAGYGEVEAKPLGSDAGHSHRDQQHAGRPAEACPSGGSEVAEQRITGPARVRAGAAAHHAGGLEEGCL